MSTEIAEAAAAYAAAMNADTAEPTQEAAPDTQEAVTPVDGVQGEPAKAGEAAPEETAEELRRRLYLTRKHQIATAKKSEREQLETERKAFQEEQSRLAEYKREVEALKRLKAGDKGAIRELGLHSREFWESLTGETNDQEPEEKRMVKELAQKIAQLEEERKAERAQLEEQRAASSAAAERHKHLSYIAENSEKYPLTTTRYNDAPFRLYQELESMAAEYAERTGQPADIDDLMEALESQENMHYTRYVSRKSGAGVVAPVGERTSGKAGGGISATAMASRETTTVDPDAHSDEERMELARAAYRKAMSQQQ